MSTVRATDKYSAGLLGSFESLTHGAHKKKLREGGKLGTWYAATVGVEGEGPNIRLCSDPIIATVVARHDIYEDEESDSIR